MVVFLCFYDEYLFLFMSTTFSHCLSTLFLESYIHVYSALLPCSIDTWLKHLIDDIWSFFKKKTNQQESIYSLDLWFLTVFFEAIPWQSWLFLENLTICKFNVEYSTIVVTGAFNFNVNYWSLYCSCLCMMSMDCWAI